MAAADEHLLGGVVMARTVAIGKQDFGNLIENNCFYVDKTNFIKEWWENCDDVTLITRPRRFGKTLTLSMADYFFSVTHVHEGNLFEGLSIWKEEKYRKLQGTYPVIFLSFADIKENEFIYAYRKIAQVLADVYNSNDFLINSDKLTDQDKKFFKMVDRDMSTDVAAISLKKLSDFLRKHYGKRPIILLDEYDTPMQEAYVYGYWDEMTSFTRGFFNSTFKTNPYLERAIMTGITRVSRESIFSDLNNLEVVSTTSEKYEASFGFTEDEVFTALGEYGLQDKMADVKEWYDGFRFGECDNIYNPWSIINFLDKRKFWNYWANTSSNDLAGRLIQSGSMDLKLAMEDLIHDKEISRSFDEEIVFDQLDRKEGAVWSLLLAGGYLKAVSSILNKRGKRDYILAVTNLEVKNIFEDMFSGWFSDERARYNDFEQSLLEGSLKRMNIYINKVALHTFSYFDTGKKPSESAEPERFYHGFVLGLIAELRDRYEVTSNRESGFGRYDVMLLPVNEMYDGIILEFKVIDADRESSLQNTADAALKQILDRNYAAMLEAKGIDRKKIRIYGFAFRGKEVLIDGGYLSSYEKYET